MSGQGEVLAERVSDEAVVGEDAAQVGVSAEDDSEEVKRLAFKPVGDGPDFAKGVHGGGFAVGAEDAESDAAVFLQGEEMADDGETGTGFGVGSGGTEVGSGGSGIGFGVGPGVGLGSGVGRPGRNGWGGRGGWEGWVGVGGVEGVGGEESASALGVLGVVHAAEVGELRELEVGVVAEGFCGGEESGVGDAEGVLAELPVGGESVGGGKVSCEGVGESHGGIISEFIRSGVNPFRRKPEPKRILSRESGNP